MRAIIWDAASRPDDADTEPDATEALVLVQDRGSAWATGVVMAVGSDVLSFRPGSFVTIPMLAPGAPAPSSLRGYTRFRVRGGVLVKLPLAEYNALAVENP